ncbi:DUF4320 family protein [Clostridium sp. KNHs216]|uniref:DUF4320 family protein n=1 Tax=Clostridium sp. KNHs216 TaxID=1550235 RepID=UPI00114F82BA|nr:DUF4320 family protein [Clostridium sp. KNHs216]TQI68562.1 uncharacterized protein DUF4320 [Clostridium sp. KNHs216]
MKKLSKILKENKGSVIFDAPFMLLIVVMILCLALYSFPAIIAKQQLDTYAAELKRTAELSGMIGTETTQKAQQLSEEIGLNPEIKWSKTGKIQLDDEFTVTCSITKDIGFGSFGSFPVPLKAKQTGRSEVYWK